MMIGPKNKRNGEYKHILLPNIRNYSVLIYNTVDFTAQSHCVASQYQDGNVLYG
jgi:hypothetical protein